MKFFALCLLAAFSASSAFNIFPLLVISRNQNQLWKPIPKRNPSRTSRALCESPNSRYDDSRKPTESGYEPQFTSTHNETLSKENATNTVLPVDPTQVALKEKEERLAKELQAWQDNLASERIHLLEVRDKLFGSGKNAYYTVQAEVNDFVRNRDAAQKADVNRNKRLFVEKMLPIVDAFRHAATITPTSTPKIESMHTNYGSLLNYILMVFTKYGFQEFAPAVGDAVDAAQHEILEVREPDNASDAPSNATHAPPGPVVVEVLGTGWRDAAQVILRKAAVVASGPSNVTSANGNAAQEDVSGVHPGDSANNESDGPSAGEGGDEQVKEEGNETLNDE